MRITPNKIKEKEYNVYPLFIGLNIFLTPQVLLKFKINPFSKLLTNLVLHL